MIMVLSTHFGHSNNGPIFRHKNRYFIGVYSVLLRTVWLDFINWLLNLIFSWKNKTFTFKSPVYKFWHQSVPYGIFRYSVREKSDVKLWWKLYHQIVLLHWIVVPQRSPGDITTQPKQSRQAKPMRSLSILSSLW